MVRSPFKYLLGSIAVVALALHLVFLPSCGGGGARTSSSPPAPPPGINPNAIVLTVQTSQQFQTFEAWRATAFGPYFLKSGGGSGLLPDALLNQILDDLVLDLGLNGLRIEVHQAQHVEVINDNNDPFVINPAGFDFASPFQIGPNEPLIDPVAEIQRVILPMKMRVESRGEPFFTYVSLIYDGYNTFPNHWHNAEEYAEVAEAYHIWAKNTFNFTPTYWVIVNEPDSAFFGSGHELENDIVATGARLRAAGFATKIQTIETARPNSSDLQTVLSNSSARQYVGLLAYHAYDYSVGNVPSFGVRNAIRNLGQQYDIPTAMTEISGTGLENGSYAHALGWARDIYWNLTEGNVSVWEPLSMAFTCSSSGCPTGGGSPIMIDPDFSRTFKFASYYGLRQFSHFIRPGYRRVGVTCSACTSSATVGQNLKPVAFQGPSGQMVVVVMNDQTTPQEIALSGLPAGSYDISGVDPVATTGMNYPSQGITSGQSLSFTMPAQSIVTFVRH